MLKVVTYNIHQGFRQGNLTLVADPIKVAVHDLYPDVLFLQEVVGENTRYKKRFDEWSDIPQHDFFKSDDLQHAYYGKNVVYPSGHHGNAVLSRIPIVHETNVDLTVFKFERRGFIYAKLHPPGKDIFVHALCIHLGLLEYERRLQVASICDYVEKHIPKDEPLLIVGDFNDWFQKVSPVFIAKLQMKEAFLEFYGSHARTFPSWMPLSRVDRIYYRHFHLKSCEILAGSPWNKLSDHLPLLAEFEFI